MTTTVVTPEATGRHVVAWHGLTTDEACKGLGVDPRQGLAPAEVERRRAEVGPNRLAEAAKEPAWHAFLRQYRDLMQLVLVGAALVSIVALQEFSTGIVILGLTVLNAILGLNQEGKAAESVAALQKMLVIRAHVRRSGALEDVPAEELVPGDVVTFEAGDKIPADGRLLVAATLEIEEAALTGESVPVLKAVDPVPGDDVPLGDRLDMAYMNSTVTRGRGEMVVTATGMSTEVGQISRMLSRVEQEKTPLTRQLDQLTVVITTMAAIALALVVVLGLIRGESFDDLFLIGISLAIAAIPTGLPAVVTTVLSLGTQALAAKGAIVKRLRSVETLGSTSAICSDKTGTLTLNQMTARQLVVAGRRYNVEGEGYSTTGKILRVAGETDVPLEPYLLPMALANDAAVRDGEIVGDPTEAALVVLAAKGGLDVDETRRAFPRVGEVPFDSDYKLMATFHEMEEDGRKVVRCFVKGAPDVLLARSAHVRDADGSLLPAEEVRDRVLAENDRLAGEGLRVLAVAARDLDPAAFRPGEVLLGEVQDLSLLALVGIVDPPRKEAKDAIARCKEAGIRARMITGDHATTAAAIAAQLGIEGRALTGTEFAALTDEELEAQVEEIGVVARVAPEDKVRLVDILKRKGNVVSMTGDGVNDAPALKRADIGVAMGITGTEVTKEAADMILTDDNFATIVEAVEGGRGIYDNLMKYVRVQLIMLGGFILTFVGAGIFDVANGSPLTPLQILWINFAVDVLLAIGLGFDAPAPGLMQRAPRDASAPIVDRQLGTRLVVASVLMAVLALVVVAWGEDHYDLAVATTMGLTTLSLMHIVAALETREPTESIFTRYTIANRRFVQLIAAALVLTFLVTELRPLQRIFDTVSLTSSQWGICLLGPIVFLALAELGKFLGRREARPGELAPAGS
ncbi:HAD-IC family P-type ATPase [Gaiella sp.]|uniref:cation-translocating P-type ATPase n=1 Tax=Gaiella sp. TaxID=2663207 RepID=UPI002BDAEDAF|nr:HAD-IC family P-type ATPase [Gaiella sp.]HWO78961.1 HAD-IC family P-type ATPase [Gaiella sp.]